MESEVFRRKLRNKVPPMEMHEKYQLQQKLTTNILKGTNVEINSEVNEDKLKQSVNNKLQVIMKKKIYNWSAISYDYYGALLYLFARSSSDYAVLMKIFTEIQNRDKNFKPRTLFDFGSGIGTVTWYIIVILNSIKD